MITLLKRKNWELLLYYPKPNGWIQRWEIVMTHLVDEYNDVFRVGWKRYHEFSSIAFVILGFGLSLEIIHAKMSKRS